MILRPVAVSKLSRLSCCDKSTLPEVWRIGRFSSNAAVTSLARTILVTVSLLAEIMPMGGHRFCLDAGCCDWLFVSTSGSTTGVSSAPLS